MTPYRDRHPLHGCGAVDLLPMPQGLAMTAAGVILGAAAALLSTRLIAELLYQASPRDPLAFAIASVSLATAS